AAASGPRPPLSTTTPRTRPCAPSPRAVSTARRATSSEPACRPWSTTSTSTEANSATAAAVRASESAPPDRATQTRSPSPGCARRNARTSERTFQAGPNQSISCPGLAAVTDPQRSEEHTSELQSRFDLVCRLLLEKKKKITET